MKTRQPIARRFLALAVAPLVAALSSTALAGFGQPPRQPPPAVEPLFLFQQTQPADGAIDGGATRPASAPATGPVLPGQLVVTAKQVVGFVTASVDDGNTWKRVAVNDTFGPGTIFRTGMRAGLTCVIGTDQMFTLESLSTIRVEEATRAGGKEKTDLVMKYGAASYGIEAAGREYDATIRTPGSTMAVRGTVVRVYDRPGFAPQAESYTGRALFRTAKGATVLGGGGGYSVASAVQGSAAETALANSTVDPSIASARTASETAVISQQLSQGGVLGFDTRAQIAVVRNGSPLPDEALPGALPGRLSFALRWTGNADLNFLVDNQAGNQQSIIFGGFQPEEIMFPGYGLNVTTSGGLIPFDNRGGPRGGTEIAYWKDSFPTGVYGVGILHASGGEATWKVNAFLDGQPVPIYTTDEEGNLLRFRTLTGEIGRGGGDGGILFVPRNPLFEDDAISTPGDDVDPIAEQVAARAIADIRAQTASAKAAVVRRAPLSLNPNLKVTNMGPKALPAKVTKQVAKPARAGKAAKAKN